MLIRTRLIMLALLAVLGAGSASAKSSDDVMNAVMPDLMRFNLREKVAAVWFTTDLWATLAAADTAQEALIAYHMMRNLGDDYFLFMIMDLADPSKGPKLDGPVRVSNDAGLEIRSVPVHKALKSMLGGQATVVAVPTRDAAGKRLVDDETKFLTLSVRSQGKKKRTELRWDLPIPYQPIVAKSVKTMEKKLGRRPKKFKDVSDVMQFHLGPLITVDLKTGLVASPIPHDAVADLLASDTSTSEDPEARAAAEDFFSTHSVFIVFSMDKDTKRVDAAIALAELITPDGVTLKPDIKGTAAFRKKMKDDDYKGLLAFPRIKAASGYTLVLRDPGSKAVNRLVW